MHGTVLSWCLARLLPVKTLAAVRWFASLAPSEVAPPPRDRGSELVVFGLIDSEIGSREPSERRQRFKEPSSVEARVLSGRQIQQRLHLEMAIQFHEIEEVAGLGPIEERKDLVGSEFLHSQRRSVVARLGWHGMAR